MTVGEVEDYVSEIVELRTQLAAAEERIKDMEIGAENACRTVSRLTAEVEEWKTNCQALEGEKDDALSERDSVAHELRTLRRTSVRVDVMLRWMRMWEGGDEGRSVDGLYRSLTRRSLRKEGEK